MEKEKFVYFKLRWMEEDNDFSPRGGIVINGKRVHIHETSKAHIIEFSVSREDLYVCCREKHGVVPNEFTPYDFSPLVREYFKTIIDILNPRGMPFEIMQLPDLGDMAEDTQDFQKCKNLS